MTANKAKIAVVSLNSLFKGGDTTFLFHLANRNPCDILVFNDSGSPRPNDAKIPSKLSKEVKYYKYSDYVKATSKYDLIIIAIMRYGGDYGFLKGSKSQYSIMMHNGGNPNGILENFHIDELLGVLDDCYINLFENDDSFSSSLGHKYRKTLIKLPFDVSLLTSFPRNIKNGIIIPTRWSYVKHSPDAVAYSAAMSRGRPIYIFANKADHGYNIANTIRFIRPDIRLNHKNDGFEALSKYYQKSGICIDGSLFFPNRSRVQYSALESAYYRCAYICTESFVGTLDLDDELVVGKNCEIINTPEADDLFSDEEHCKFLSDNLSDIIPNHNPRKIFEIMVNFV